MSNQGTLESYGSTAADYSTTVIRKAASAFIAEPSTQPFFAYVAVFGPHAPPKPAPVDVGVYATIDPYRPASFDEPDVSDKPAYVQQTPRLADSDIQKIDDHRRAHLETLRSVDRMVRAFTDQLAASGELEDTVIVFTSDNGLLWGEHRQTGKYLPYEESVHVPLAIRYDGATPPGVRLTEMVWNGDIAPTIAALAGVTSPPGLDGRSLVPVIDGTATAWPTSVPIAHGGDSNKPTYCGTRTLRYAYTIHATGEEELYDDAIDPLQLTNVADDPAYQAIKARLRTSTEATCDPPPPGFTFPAP
jgi:arylsulfatase A-like enzyme